MATDPYRYVESPSRCVWPRHRIQALTARAVATLDELLDGKKHPAVRLGAARSILELATIRYDADTLLARLEDLEAASR